MEGLILERNIMGKIRDNLPCCGTPKQGQVQGLVQPPVRSCGESLHLCRHLAQDDLFQVDLVASIVNVNADEMTFGVVIQDNPFRYFSTFHTWLGGEIYVKGISLWIVFQFHDLNLLSGKAL